MITKTRKAIAASGTTSENEPIIKSDGDGEVTQWIPSDGVVADGITIDEPGTGNPLRLGIGVAAPTVALDVAGSAKITPTGNVKSLYLSGATATTDNAFQVDADALTDGRIAYFKSNASSTNTRSLVYIKNDNPAATGTTCLQVRNDSTGPAISIEGAGIKFPATQVASADANTLDDYEEGSWSPTLPGGGTLTVSYAAYTKIGQQVTVNFYITSVAPTADTTRFDIGGLPFTCSDAANAYQSGNIGYVGSGDWSDVGFVGGRDAAFLYFHDLDGSSSAVTNNEAIAKWGGSAGALIGQLTYIVKST